MWFVEHFFDMISFVPVFCRTLDFLNKKEKKIIVNRQTLRYNDKNIF